MPIKPGDMVADASDPSASFLSDGKRMRVLWSKDDGDGDPSPGMLINSKNTARGHPTWTLFCGTVANPIVRGESEPPHYVYLDDRACYAIWSSGVYTKVELAEYWPFDFEHTGRVKTGRPNRGRPAYADEARTKIATTLIRKNIAYEFRGGVEEVGGSEEEEDEA